MQPAGRPEPVDVVVAGGSLAGCLTALACARRGLRTALLERRWLLGGALTAGLRPWLGVAGLAELPDHLRELFLPAAEAAEVDYPPDELPAAWRDEVPLFVGTLRKTLLAALREAGVAPLLTFAPAGVVTCGGPLGVLAASRWGCHLVRARHLLDAGGLPRGEVAGPVRLTLGFAGAELPPERWLEPPDSLRLLAPARWHAGKSRVCPVYLELTLDAEDSRRRAIEVARWVFGHVPGFAEARLVELSAEPTPESPSPDSPGLTTVPKLPLEATAADLAELWRQAEALATGLASGPIPELGRQAVVRSGWALHPLSAAGLGAEPTPEMDLELLPLELAETDLIPLLDSAGVLVAGGGTGGVGTALGAAEGGADTAIVEMLPGLGGTKTLGLVTGYYHGWLGGFTKRLDDRARTFAAWLHGRPVGADRLTRQLACEAACRAAGVRLWLEATCCAARLEGRRVTGLVAATDRGLERLAATVTVDATGDGDLAALAGCRFTFGHARTGTVQDFSQWGRGEGHWTHKSKDVGVIDQTSPGELLRGLAEAHETAPWYDFAAFLTPREGRHILGEVTVDVRDVIESRRFPDSIALARTDWDVHGLANSWLGRLGLMPLQVADSVTWIPYRACLPVDRDCLLISAKAISATVDAACYCRMTADIQNLGYALGRAAALALAHRGDVRAIDVAGLQATLRELGDLPDEAPEPPLVSGTPEERVARLAAGEEEALLAVVVLPAEVARPLLEAAWEQGGERRLLARALAWVGERRGVEVLLAELRELLPTAGEPYADDHPHKPGKPRAGIVDAPDDWWRVNQLVFLLGLLAVDEAVEPLAELIDRTTAGGPPVREHNTYITHRIDLQRVPHYDRLLNLAFAAERLAAPALARPLERLLEREHIGGYRSTDSRDAGRRYLGALAEVLLAAAAARCGSVLGADRLVDYLTDVHAILARLALRELRAVTCQNLGRDADAWREALSVTAIQPTPYRGPKVF